MIRFSLLVAVVAVASRPAIAAEPLAKQARTDRGICVLVGETSADRITALARDTELMIVAQVRSQADVRRLRSAMHRERLLGTRVYVSRVENGRLCLADDLAGVVIATSELPREELMRVLRPRGRLVHNGKVETKPVPAGTGDWTHPYQDAANNPLAKDQLAKAPYLTKFLATPHYGPMPEITLSAGGRLFKAFGHLAFKQREWPMLGKLVCIDAYNGVQLWDRDMTPGFMIHRNTLVATEDTLYLADHVSCKLIDAATGKVRDEIVVPKGLADGPVWKWMTIEDGVLYALVGEEEELHAVHRGTRTERGWPWTRVKSTYGKQQGTWGFGKTLFAMDLKSKSVLWSKQESQPIDSRAMCMSHGKIYMLSHGRYLTAVNAKDGADAWRTVAADVIKAIGAHDPADNPRLGYATSSYLKCNEDALFFAGPQRKQLVVVSAKDGKLLWSAEDGNRQLIIRPDGLYAMGRMQTSKKYEPLTGEVLADLLCFRGNCTRATGTADSIFTRGYRHTGTMRFDLYDQQPHRIPSMRPACQDGVIAANSQLYWGPWMCDCNHSLVGVISLASAGKFDFQANASNAKNLRTEAATNGAPTLRADENDWPTYRADNRRSSSIDVEIPTQVDVAWRHQSGKHVAPTPAITVGDLAFLSGTDGTVHALSMSDGKPRWTAHTGGRVFYPPSFSEGRLFAGSADGFIYAWDAANGRPLWRFRAAPVERHIPVYGRLSSTWPVASGVLAEGDNVFAAAGIAGHDGTYVYGLNATTGEIVWQNTESDNLIGGEEVTGVSVQGHLLLHNDRLFMAGGNVVSPAIYDLSTGKCLNELKEASADSLDSHWQMQRSSRGSELFLSNGTVMTGGRMLYSAEQDGIPSRYNGNYALEASNRDFVIRGNGQSIERINPAEADPKKKAVWRRKWFTTSDAIVVARNAVIVAGQMPDVTQDRKVVPAILALNLKDGNVLWSHRLPARAVAWGVAVNRDGNVLVSLGSGEVMCLTKK